MTSNWRSIITSAESSISIIEQAVEELSRYRDSATAEIAKYLRVKESGIELDPDAGRYRVNQEEIQRLKTLSSLRRGS